MAAQLFLESDCLITLDRPSKESQSFFAHQNHPDDGRSEVGHHESVRFQWRLVAERLQVGSVAPGLAVDAVVVAEHGSAVRIPAGVRKESD